MKAILVAFLILVFISLFFGCSNDNIISPAPIETRSKIHYGQDSNNIATVKVQTSTSKDGLDITITTTINDTNNKNIYYMAGPDSTEAVITLLLYKTNSNNTDSLISEMAMNWKIFNSRYKFDKIKTQNGTLWTPPETLLYLCNEAARGNITTKLQLTDNNKKKLYNFTIKTEYDFMENSIYR